MITLTDYFLAPHFVEAIWPLIISGSKIKKKGTVMTLTSWFWQLEPVLSCRCHPQCQAHGDLPGLARRAQLRRSYGNGHRQSRSSCPVGSKSPHWLCIAGGHSLHGEGVRGCFPATCHGAQATPGSAQRSHQATLPPVNCPTAMAVEDLHGQMWGIQGRGRQGDFGGHWCCLEAVASLHCWECG